MSLFGFVQKTDRLFELSFDALQRRYLLFGLNNRLPGTLDLLVDCQRARTEESLYHSLKHFHRFQAFCNHVLALSGLVANWDQRNQQDIDVINRWFRSIFLQPDDFLVFCDIVKRSFDGRSSGQNTVVLLDPTYKCGLLLRVIETLFGRSKNQPGLKAGKTKLVGYAYTTLEVASAPWDVRWPFQYDKCVLLNFVVARHAPRVTPWSLDDLIILEVEPVMAMPNLDQQKLCKAIFYLIRDAKKPDGVYARQRLLDHIDPNLIQSGGCCV